MGIATGTFQQLLREHQARPFGGSLLTLGKQDIYLTEADVRYWLTYYGVPCPAIEEPELSGKPALAAQRYLSDRALFTFLGTQSESLDASSYEGCDHVADLNDPTSVAGLEGRYDLVLDTGTLEHVFHLPNAFAACHALLRTGGRVIHMSPLGNYADHGFYMMSPTLFLDFYETNGWLIRQIKIIRHTRNHDTEPYWVTDYSPDHFAQLSFGGLGDGLYQTFVVAEKLPGATANRIPQQRAYRLQAWVTPPPAAPAGDPDARVGAQIRTRLAQQAPLLTSMAAAHPHPRVAVFGAGRHTSILLDIWRQHLPEPAMVIQSSTPASAEFGGLPLLSVDQAKLGERPHLIVLSSQLYESDMAETCARAFPSVPVLRIWS